MRIVHLTPGAGGMYCGACLRDNALVKALRGLGHEVLMVPLYLPLTLDEPDQSASTPIFFSGLNVFLDQKSAWFRRAPAWVHGLLTSRPLLRWAAGRAAGTRAQDLGDLTHSMLLGEDGCQARELNDLLAWLKRQPRPDVICLSNALLLGLARRLRSELAAPVVCGLQGEDTFLDALPEPHRSACWKTLADRAADVALFIAPSRYFAGRMRERFGLAADRIRVVHNGINLEGYEGEARSAPATERGCPSRSGPERAEVSESAPGLSALGRAAAGTAALRGGSDEMPPAGGGRIGGGTEHAPGTTHSASIASATEAHSSPGQHPPALGFLARMSAEKGLDTLVAAYIRLRQRGRVGNLKLRIGGSCGPADQQFVSGLREQLRQAGLLGEADFCPNLSREGKLAFLKSLSVFSVPALYGEAFGLYVLEALAAGVPAVQPRSGAFPELIETTGGGVLCEPGDPEALAQAIESLLANPDQARALGEAGRRAVFARFSSGAMAREVLRVYAEATGTEGAATRKQPAEERANG